MYLGATDPKIIKRQKLEARIVKAIIGEALKQGYAISVDDGGDESSAPSTDRKTIIDLVMETDDDYLEFFTKNGKRMGWVRLVYGNDGWDVICDNSANDATESVLAPANKIVEKYS